MFKYHFTHIINENTDNEEEIEVIAHCYIEPKIKGRYYGPPEDCYPDEGGYAEIDHLTTLDGKLWQFPTFALEEKITQEAYLAWEESRQSYLDSEY